MRFDSVQSDEYDCVGDSRFKLEPGSSDLKFPPHIKCAPAASLFYTEDEGPVDGRMRTPSKRDPKGRSAPRASKVCKV